MTRIHCHSSYSHYNMYHGCGGGMTNFGSIFNTTINCNGGHTNFWGGFGAGLGFGLSNLFGGLGNMFGMGGFGNMFGFGGMGFGMPWGMGFGMPWGMGFGMPWGGSGNVGKSDKSSSSSSHKCEDKDDAKYKELKSKVDDAIKKGKFDDDVKALYNDIKKVYESPIDSEHEDMNRGAYHDLLTALEKKFPELTKSSATTTPEENKTPENTTINDATIDGIKDKAALDKLTPDQIKGLTPEQAKKILTNLGLYTTSGSYAMFDPDYKVLLVLEKSGLNVQVAYNTRATVNDGYIRGQIDNVEYDKNTKEVTYRVKNSTVSGDYGLDYTFKGKDGTFKLIAIYNDTHIGKTNNTGSCFFVRTGWEEREYTFSSTNKQLEINADPLISKANGDQPSIRPDGGFINLQYCTHLDLNNNKSAAGDESIE